MNNSNEPKLVCRKCQGAHLTIKCGKENKSIVESELKSVDKKTDYRKDDHKKDDHKKDDHKKDDHKKDDHKTRKPLHKVKMSNLPIDMTEDELRELLYEWGHVVRMRVMNYENSSTAYIEFKDEEPANYIVEALHKTPFEHILIEVERLYD